MNRTALSPQFHRVLFLAALLCAVLNFIAFYPGILHHDAWAYFSQAHEGRLNNWQPPLLGYLWLPLQAIYFGPQPMLVLFVAAYWSGFYFLAHAFEPVGRALAAWVFAAALFPMALNFTGVLVKDIAMSDCLLVGGGIAAAITAGALRKNATALAVMWFFLIASGFVRANALFAFPPLFDLALAATSHRYAAMFWWKRAAMACLLALAFIPGNILADRYVFPLYERLSAIAPLQIFDIGGISYFSGTDYFRGELGADFLEKNRACYTPRHWDVYGWLGCAGSYDKLKPKFGAPLTKLWVEAIVAHPLDYLRHRIGHFNRFMQFICRDCQEMVFTGMQSTNQHLFTFTPTFLYEAIDWGSETWDASPFGKPYVWLLLCLAWSAAAFGIPNERTRYITLMLTLSGAMYALAFTVVGIASDYRYIDWTMLCALIATPVIMSRVIFRRGAAPALRIAPSAVILAVILMREIAVRFLL
jgi:hypothetical protein